MVITLKGFLEFLNITCRSVSSKNFLLLDYQIPRIPTCDEHKQVNHSKHSCDLEYVIFGQSFFYTAF